MMFAAIKVMLVSMGVSIVASGMMSCATNNMRNEQVAKMTPGATIEAVLEAHTDELMSLPGVVGVAIGVLSDGTRCIKVMVIEKTPDLEKKIPSALEGYPVVVEGTGEIRALPEK